MSIRSNSITRPPGDLIAQLNAEDLIRSAHQVIDIEQAGITAIKERLNTEFVQACQILYQCNGRIVVMGMGKSGHIGSKIAATLASTGSPAFFVHPGEASHGDLGMITHNDVVLALSYSGETDELLTLLPMIHRMAIPFIAMTGSSESTLAQKATVHVDVSVPQEACPLGLAPTSSSTASLVMGDALAISLLEARGFTRDDFARSHPGGQLGRRLLIHISDIMHMGDQVPLVNVSARLPEVIVEMTRKGLGMTAIVDDDQRLLGIFTDGDLRRTLEADEDLNKIIISEFMTRDCKTIGRHELAAEAASIMEDYKVHSLLVVDEEHVVVGALNVHDLLAARVI